MCREMQPWRWRLITPAQSGGCSRALGSGSLWELGWTSLACDVFTSLPHPPTPEIKANFSEPHLLHTGDSLTPKTSLTSLTGCLFFFLSVWVYVLYLFFTAAAWVRVNVDRRALPSSSSFPETRVDNPTSCNHSASSSPSGEEHEQGEVRIVSRGIDDARSRISGHTRHSEASVNV